MFDFSIKSQVKNEGCKDKLKILEDKTVVTVQWQELQYAIKPKTG